jgi:TatD DNase family protein
MFIDTHTHLYVDAFDEDRDDVIKECISSSIDKLLLPNIDVQSIPRLLTLAKSYPKTCYPMMGLHPCSVNSNFENDLEIIKKVLDENKFIAVGEIGIDLYWEKSTLSFQEEAFAIQIEWAKKKKLPIVIHARESYDEIFKVLDKYNDENLSGVFHCFTGTKNQANQIINYGNFKLGIGGVVTFKNGGLDNTLKDVAIEQIVLETDSPYLSPSPFRGKRNKSPYLIYIAEKLSEIYNCRLDEIANQTTKNALEIFKLD